MARLECHVLEESTSYRLLVLSVHVCNCDCNDGNLHGRRSLPLPQTGDDKRNHNRRLVVAVMWIWCGTFDDPSPVVAMQTVLMRLAGVNGKRRGRDPTYVNFGTYPIPCITTIKGRKGDLAILERC